jgi:hypothetical protein
MKAYRVIKVNAEEGDANPNGSKGFLIGEMEAPPTVVNNITVNKMYIISWDNYPDNIIFTIDFKIKKLHDQLIDIELNERAKEYLEKGLPPQFKNILKHY